jgi:hypothetical protein
MDSGALKFNKIRDRKKEIEEEILELINSLEDEYPVTCTYIDTDLGVVTPDKEKTISVKLTLELNV